MSGTWIVFCTSPRRPKPVDVVTYLTQHRLAVSVSETLPEYLDMWSTEWQQLALRTALSDMAILLSCMTRTDRDFDATIQFWMMQSQQGCLRLFSGVREQIQTHLRNTRFIIELDYGAQANPEIIALLLHYFEEKFGGMFFGVPGA